MGKLRNLASLKDQPFPPLANFSYCGFTRNFWMASQRVRTKPLLRNQASFRLNLFNFFFSAVPWQMGNSCRHTIVPSHHLTVW